MISSALEVLVEKSQPFSQTAQSTTTLKESAPHAPPDSLPSTASVALPTPTITSQPRNVTSLCLTARPSLTIFFYVKNASLPLFSPTKDVAQQVTTIMRPLIIASPQLTTALSMNLQEVPVRLIKMSTTSSMEIFASSCNTGQDLNVLQ